MEAYILVYRYAPTCTCEFEYMCVCVCVRVCVVGMVVTGLLSGWPWWRGRGCWGMAGWTEAWTLTALSLDFMKYLSRQNFSPCKNVCELFLEAEWAVAFLGCRADMSRWSLWKYSTCSVYFVSEMWWRCTSYSIMACANVCSSSSSSSLTPTDSTCWTIGCSILPHCMIRLGICHSLIVVSAYCQSVLYC